MKKSNFWLPAVLFVVGLALGFIGLSAFDGEPGETWFHAIGWTMAALGIIILAAAQPRR